MLVSNRSRNERLYRESDAEGEEEAPAPADEEEAAPDGAVCAPYAASAGSARPVDAPTAIAEARRRPSRRF